MRFQEFFSSFTNMNETRKKSIQNFFKKIFKAAFVRFLVVIGEMIAIVIIILQINIWPEALPIDVLEKKYIREISAGVLSSGILFIILYYFQGDELISIEEKKMLGVESHLPRDPPS